MSATLHTCARCGLTDDSVLDLDTGGRYHRELFHCITMLRQRYEPLIIAAERLDAVHSVPTAKADRVHAIGEVRKAVRIAKARGASR